MAKNLRKFVNPKFLRTCDLSLMHRLMTRHATAIRGFELAVLDGDPEPARDALSDFFAGAENAYPPGLTADLHRIAALGNRHGRRLILERARSAGVDVGSAAEDSDDQKLDAKYVALWCFLEHPAVFNAASDLIALEARVALTELRGTGEGVRATLDQTTREAFERAAKRFLAGDGMGGYCRVGWYDDGDEINIVAIHGTEITTEWVVENEDERVISFRPLGTAVLTYDPAEGRLKVGGLDKSQRGKFAELFAAAMLDRPGFFGMESCRELYTLDPVERAGFGFEFDHRFDPGILSVRIVEAQAERSVPTRKGKRAGRLWSVLVKDRSNALQRMGQVAHGMSFGPDHYRLASIVLRVEFDSETRPHPTVTVKIEPPEAAMFKREFFERRIMELLGRNGLCLERNPDQAAVAA